MRAIRIEEHGGFDVLKVVEEGKPVPGPGEVCLEVAAYALNHLDVWVRRGVPGHAFPLPIVPGSDGSGRIEAIGDGVTGVEIGDAVFALPGLSNPRGEHVLRGEDHLDDSYDILGESCDGLAREFAVLPATNVAPIPEGLSFVEAAAFPLSFLTAWNMVVRRARVEPGETVFVQAGASGVGVAAIQIAKLLGARVIATAGSDEKCERLLDLGVEMAICYERENVVEAVKRFRRSGVHVVIDHVGAATFGDSVRCLARAGRFVTCGATTGTEVSLHLNHVFFKSLSILGSTMGRRGDLLQIAQLLAQGSLRPIVGHVLQGLESTAEGHRLLEERRVFGKVVLELEKQK